MKILKLNIHNIASIEDAEINFEEQPLAQSEVFLIAGKTGSGKSTILDAICLALFDNTPRLNNTNIEGKDPNDKDISTSSQLQLLRRNTAEGWVKLWFLGSNGKHYESFWTVARAYKKVTGSLNLRSRKWFLTIVEDNKQLNKIDEIKEEISKAIGLDFSQFCRTTMLAQGEFTKFLNSKDDDKCAILEKITGIDIYSKIGAKVFEITKTKKDDYDKALERVNQMEILSDEKIAEIQGNISKLNAENAELVKRQKEVNDKKTWLEDLTKKTTEAATAATQLSEAQEKVQSDEFKQQESLVNDWNATIEARSWLKERNAQAQALKTLEEEMRHHLDTFATYKQGERAMSQNIDRCRDTLSQQQAMIDEQSDKKNIFDQQLAINEKLNTLHNCNQAIARENEAIDRANALLSGKLKTAKEKAEREHKAKDDVHKTLHDSHASLVKELEECHIAQLRNRANEVNDTLHNIETAKLVLENRDTGRQQVEQKRDALNDIDEIINDLRAKLEKFKQAKQEATIALNSKRETYDKLRESVEQWAKDIRSKLKIGDKCPVCQREITHALPHEDEINSVFIAADNDLKQAQDALDEATNNYNHCDANIKAQERQKAQVLKELNTAKTYLENQEKQLVKACAQCGITTLNDNILQLLEDKKQKFDAENAELQTKLAHAEDLERKAGTALQDRDNARKELDKAKQDLDKASEAITKCTNDIDKSRRVISENDKQVKDLSEDISSMLGDTTWQHNWKTETQEFALELEKLATDYKSLVEKHKNLQITLYNLKQEHENIKESLNAIVGLVPSFKEAQDLPAREIANLLSNAGTLRSQVAATQQQIDSTTNTHKELGDNLAQFVEQHPSYTTERLTQLAVHSRQDIAQLQQQLQRDKDRVVACEAAVKLKKNELETHRNNKPELDVNDTIESLTAKLNEINGEIHELGEKVGGLNFLLQNDATNKEKQHELIVESDRRKGIYQQWERLNNLIGDRTGKNFRTIALSYILENLIQSANYYMHTLSDRYTLNIQPGSAVINVVDAYQGYALRATSTISGGESFLVSLALALALSDIAQQLRVDMLFIDEGFGSLSGEPLQKAINTLRTLHNATGRQVGIISHIEELKERIPVQIQVNQEGNSSSSTVKVVSL